MSPQRDKLVIPETTSITDVKWVNALVLFPEPRHFPPKEEGWSDSYLYGVKANGVEYSLFASPTLHKMIQEIGATKDTVIRISKTGQKQSTKWFVEYVNGPQVAVNGQSDPAPTTAATPHPQQPETPTKSNGQSSPHTSQNVYQRVSTDTVGVLRTMLEDIQTVRMLAEETVRDNYPNSWNSLDALDRENLIATAATGNRITLDGHLRSMAGGWNSRSDYGSFNTWTTKNGGTAQVPENLGSEDDQEEDDYEEPNDPRWPKIKSVNIANPQTRAVNLATAIAKEDDKITSGNHVLSILKRFGYSTVGIDRLIHWQMASMVWLYVGLREEGAAQNDALRNTAEVFSHPQDMIDWFEEKPSAVIEDMPNVSAEEMSNMADELGGTLTENDDDDLSF